jgi:ribokinase
MAAPVLLSLGSINADFQAKVPQAPDPGRTLPATDFARLPGGKAANRAWLARRLGHPARLLGRVGEDDLCEQALAPLRAEGVDLSGVSVAPGQSTAVSMIAALPDGKKSIVLAGNANQVWDDASRQAVLAAIAAAPAGSVLAVDLEVPADIVLAAADAAIAKGIPVVIDPSPADRVPMLLLDRAGAITPNPSEAETLTGITVDGADTAEAAARCLAGGRSAIACVKLPDGGCVMMHGKRLVHIPSVPVEVVDSTGAGDAFAGGLAVALLEGLDAVPAALFATAASHAAVTGYGSQHAGLARQAIEALHQRLLPGMRLLENR